MVERAPSATELLSSVPIFQGLSPSQLTQIAGQMKRQSYPRGKAIAGGKNDRLFVVEEGTVTIALPSAAGSQRVLSAGRGEAFGVLSFFGADGHPIEAAAETDAVVNEISRSSFQDLMRADPNIGAAITLNLARTVRHFANRVEAATLLDLEGRLAREILSMRGKRVPSQAGLATLVGASRGAVNAVLSNWRRAGIVKMRWGKLDVMNADELSRRAQVPPEKLGTFLRALGPGEAYIG
jgi:CRP-like cAMP-binding protein